MKAIIEAILFASGKEVSKKQLALILEVSIEDLEKIVENMKEEDKQENRGVEIITVDDNYQLSTKKELYDFIYPVIDKRAKPNLSNAALETLSIIAYNPRITRAEIESIRGVSADGCIYKLLEYGLIEEAGKADLPGKPMTYTTSQEFLKMFGYSSLNVKLVNDEYGHDKGDIYLKTACRTIGRIFKHSPLYRVGGDEFAVILSNEDYKNMDALFTRFDEERARINESARERWEQVQISTGFAIFDPSRDSKVIDVLRRADKIMYEDKRNRKASRSENS